MGVLRLAPGAAVPKHRDPAEEYLFVLEGSGTLTIDGIIHEITPGTYIFMPQNAEVSFQNGTLPFVAVQVFAKPHPSEKYEGWEKMDN